MFEQHLQCAAMALKPVLAIAATKSAIDSF